MRLAIVTIHLEGMLLLVKDVYLLLVAVHSTYRIDSWQGNQNAWIKGLSFLTLVNDGPLSTWGHSCSMCYTIRMVTLAMQTLEGNQVLGNSDIRLLQGSIYVVNS